jgi:rhodanese-related sulfurtransferase
MRRRAYLASVVGVISLTAGCSADPSGNYEDVVDPDPSTTELGLAPDSADGESRDVDVESFETVQAGNDENTALRAVPLDVAQYWYESRKARFVDARTAEQYGQHHVEGAVHSPAPYGGAPDPVTEWDKNERTVMYCTCPHHLSSIRAGNHIEAGGQGAYILGPGLEPWAENDYPTAGSVENKENFVDDYSNVEGDHDDHDHAEDE